MVNGVEKEVCDLLTSIVRSLVDQPENVQVQTSTAEDNTTLRVSVHPTDVGKLIGIHGRTARALRTIVAANSKRLQRRFSVDIIEQR